MNPELQTARLVLQPLSDRHAPGLHQAFGDAQAMTFRDAPPAADVLETAARIGRSLSAPPAFHAAWALTRRGDGAVVRTINYHHRDLRSRRLELGWITVPAHQGQSLMAEAAEAVLALARRLGMVCESGLLRDRLLVAGSFRSSLMFGLLKPDWLARHAG